MGRSGGPPSVGKRFLARPSNHSFIGADVDSFTERLFLILILSPVWGLRPERGPRSLIEKVPNPGQATFSPAFTCSAV